MRILVAVDASKRAPSVLASKVVNHPDRNALMVRTPLLRKLERTLELLRAEIPSCCR